DAGGGAERLEPAAAARGEALTAELDRLVEAAGAPGPDVARAGEHGRRGDRRQAAVADDPAAADEDGVDGARRRAQGELPQRVVERREDVAREVEEDEVGAAARLDPAEPVGVAGRPRAADRRELPRLTRAEPLLVVHTPELV